MRRRGAAEFHGFEIAKQLADEESRRLLTAYGTLYRALARLESMGLVTSRREDPSIAAAQNRPIRRLYTLTAAGETAAEEAPAISGSRADLDVSDGKWRQCDARPCPSRGGNRSRLDALLHRGPAGGRAQPAARRGSASDLWEAAHAPDRDGWLPLSLGMFLRLVAGFGHDSDLAQGTGGHNDSARTIGHTHRPACRSRPGLDAVHAGHCRLPKPAPAPRQLRTTTLRTTPPPPSPPPAVGTQPPPAVTFTYADVAYKTIDGATPPARINDMRPVHPPIAKWNGVGGTVVLDASIDEDGRVSDIHVRESVPMLDQSAVDAIGRWTFAPAAAMRAPVAIRVTATYPLSSSDAR